MTPKKTKVKNAEMPENLVNSLASSRQSTNQATGSRIFEPIQVEKYEGLVEENCYPEGDKNVPISGCHICGMEACEESRCSSSTALHSAEAKSVIPKPTNASVLREAATILKQNKKEEDKISKLLWAGTYMDYEQYFHELRKEQEKEELIDLEKKHLAGQLSYEEAILAKKKLMEVNAKKREEFLAEKAKLEEDFEVYRKEEMEKAKEMIKNVHEQRETTRRVQEMTVKTKQKLAKTLAQQKDEMMKKYLQEKEEEIEKKIAAIRELKILQKIRRIELNIKEEQMMKLVNVSVEELKARLELCKQHLQEDLDNRRCEIIRLNSRRSMLKSAAENFVKEVRECQKQMKEQESEANALDASEYRKIIEDENLRLLRLKLENARMERLSYQKERVLKKP